MAQKFGHYTVLEPIGRGGMSIVYRATQESIGREVAVKVLLGSLVEQDKTFLERFYREVQIAAKLQHPHILPVHDFGVHEGQPYIVMAYLRGGTLSDRIKQGPMSLAEVLSLIAQIAEALDFAHNQGIIHRDIKPSNVMLDAQGNGYLADFGLAKISDASTELTGSRLVGTPDYMAPDLSEADAITPAVDIYALGVTVFQMLDGHVPFRANTQMGVLMAHMTQPVPDVRTARPDLSETIQQVIATAMSKKPGERYSSAGMLYEALKSVSKEAQHAPH
ncbi:MAG: serine/threonine-protein kinase, partial [Chloroflexota bacterium]